MKKTTKSLMATLLFPLVSMAYNTETFYGVQWKYIVNLVNCTATIGTENFEPAIDQTFSGELTVPANIHGLSVTEIGYGAFRGCSKLTGLKIPATVISIDPMAFQGCDALVKFEVDPDNPVYKSANGVILSRDGTILHVGINGNVEIPQGVTQIGDHAFSERQTLMHVDIPSSVTNINQYAFSFCTSLKSVVIPHSVINIGEGAFVECRALSSITINEGVSEIGYVAFNNCSALQSIAIPASVLTIGDFAFDACSSLQSVYFKGNAPVAAGIYGEVPEEDGGVPQAMVSYVGASSTGWLTKDSTSLPETWCGHLIAHGETPVVLKWQYTTKNGKACIKGVSDVNGATISGSVKIPSEVDGLDVIEILPNAFAGTGYDKITSIEVPATVRVIGSNAFAGCYGLDEVAFLGDAPFAYADAFCGTKSTLKFSVPENSIGWSVTSLKGLPNVWGGRAIQYANGGQSEDGPIAVSTVTVSNVVVHYLLNSIRPEFSISPTADTGFVNVITEVKSSGVAAIPASWAKNYPDFERLFGCDFTTALGRPTGKIGTGGAPMLVWQDYVAGTDPTKKDDVFTASITIVDGKVKISYSPELDEERKAMRKYTTYGKVKLTDKDWTVVAEGAENNFNFFKVTVELK